MEDERSFEERLALFRKMMDESERIAFFGGAGVSTESGIPDFRSPDGLYSEKNAKNPKNAKFARYEPEYLLSRECLYHNPKVFFSFYRSKMDFRRARPNPAHEVLAELERSGKRVDVVTQNVDGLHQKAGSERVHEVHGTTRKCSCTKCGRRFDGNLIFESWEEIPKCPVCGGMLRPDVTLYGEVLPKDAVNDGSMAIYEADLLVIAGTSLTVEPAASMVGGFRGKYVVVINRTPLEGRLGRESVENAADLIFREPVGEVLDALLRKPDEPTETESPKEPETPKDAIEPKTPEKPEESETTKTPEKAESSEATERAKESKESESPGRSDEMEEERNG